MPNVDVRWVTILLLLFTVEVTSKSPDIKETETGRHFEMSTHTAVMSNETSSVVIPSDLNISDLLVSTMDSGTSQISHNMTKLTTYTPTNIGTNSNLAVSNYVVMAGDTAILTCSYNTSPVSWQLNFSVNGTELRLNNGYKFVSVRYHLTVVDNGTELLIYNTSKDDAGSYSCTEARTNTQRIAQLVVLVSNSTCHSTETGNNSNPNSIWCSNYYYGYWDPVMYWTVENKSVTYDVTMNKTAGRYTSTMTLQRRREVYEAYIETYQCITRFTLDKLPWRTDGRDVLSYEDVCAVTVAWPAQPYGEGRYIVTDSMNATSESPVSRSAGSKLNTTQMLGAARKEEVVEPSASRVDIYIFAGVITSLVVLFACVIVVVLILYNKRVKSVARQRASAADATTSGYERTREGVHRYQELNTDASRLNGASPYNEPYDDPDYAYPDQKRSTYAYIPTDLYPDVSQSLELSQISVTGPRLPPRKDSAVAECTSGTSVGPGELCTSGVSVGPGELCTSGTFATNTWETRSGDGTPASSASETDSVAMKLVNHGYLSMPHADVGNNAGNQQLEDKTPETIPLFQGETNKRKHPWEPQTVVDGGSGDENNINSDNEVFEMDVSSKDHSPSKEVVSLGLNNISQAPVLNKGRYLTLFPQDDTVEPIE